jgi:hypothetical protein
MREKTIGLLHPGEMGSSLGAALRVNATRVLWAGEGRSARSRERAERAGLIDGGTLAQVVPQSSAIVSICPPHAALDVAEQVAAHGKPDLYIDANAVAPGTVEKVAQLLGADAVVDGSVVGNPAWRPDQGTSLLLSGPRAEEAAALFADTNFTVRVLGDRIGQASMAKACFALKSKALPTLWLAIQAAADGYGVADEVGRLLGEAGADLAAEVERINRRAHGKAWRWSGEMEEAGAALAAAGLPDGWSLAAAEMYRRIADGEGSAADGAEG